MPKVGHHTYVSSNYENTTKIVKADLTKTMILRRTPTRKLNW